MVSMATRGIRTVHETTTDKLNLELIVIFLGVSATWRLAVKSVTRIND
jgi:hypothetical protein